MRSGVLAVAATAFALSACAGDRLWMKAGAGPTEARDDAMSCAEASDGGSGVSFGDTGSMGLGAPTDRFSNRYACLRSRGYRLVTVTGEEAERLKAASGVERQVFWRELQQKYGVEP